jgi:hypothetical protein
MTLRHRLVITTLVAGAALACAAMPASAQAQRGQRQSRSTQAPAAEPQPGTGDPSALSAAQIQRWFEAFTVLQAQDALTLSEGQYGRFVTRFKALQDVRRKHQQQRARMLAELRKMTEKDSVVEDTQISERLKALQAHDEAAARALRTAHDGVDETLDLRQQARFRIFEERMEQQKLEMLMRARQNARAAARRGRGE